MKDYVNTKIDTIKVVLDSVISTNANGKEYEFDEAIRDSVSVISLVSAADGKVMIIGNGASASIASHIAVDFWKNTCIRATSFNDSALLTCISNDYGYEHVFEKPVGMFSKKEDLLIAISSSGQSKNILLAVKAAKEKGIKVLTLSGFKKDNPLRKLGDINFYAPASEYGYVEVTHHFICHCLVDIVAKKKNG
jgi:D-sedoheptulose 7-phosphate isomerase